MTALTVATDAPTDSTVSVTTASKMIGVSVAAVRKLIAAEVLTDSPRVCDVLALAALPTLRVTGGELPVIRVGGKGPYRPGAHRPHLGTWCSATDTVLAENTLAWWEVSPERVLDSGFLLITTGYLPMVLWQITDLADTVTDDNGRYRHRFTGNLLARRTPSDSPWRTSEVSVASGPHAALAAEIIGSWAPSKAGGPAAYLPADAR